MNPSGNNKCCENDTCITCEEDIESLPDFINIFGKNYSTCLACGEDYDASSDLSTMTQRIMKEICIKSIVSDVNIDENSIDESFPFCQECVETKVSKLTDLYRQLQVIQEEFNAVRSYVVQGIIKTFVAHHEDQNRDEFKLFEYWKKIAGYPLDDNHDKLDEVRKSTKNSDVDLSLIKIENEDDEENHLGENGSFLFDQNVLIPVVHLEIQRNHDVEQEDDGNDSSVEVDFQDNNYSYARASPTSSFEDLQVASSTKKPSKKKSKLPTKRKTSKKLPNIQKRKSKTKALKNFRKIQKPIYNTNKKSAKSMKLKQIDTKELTKNISHKQNKIIKLPTTSKSETQKTISSSINIDDIPLSQRSSKITSLRIGNPKKTQNSAKSRKSPKNPLSSDVEFDDQLEISSSESSEEKEGSSRKRKITDQDYCYELESEDEEFFSDFERLESLPTRKRNTKISDEDSTLIPPKKRKTKEGDNQTKKKKIGRPKKVKVETANNMDMDLTMPKENAAAFSSLLSARVHSLMVNLDGPPTIKKKRKRKRENVPRMCEECGKILCSAYNLKLHMRTHTNTKPYPCDRCEMRFYKPENLKSHYITHTRERSLMCEICKCRFAYRAVLRSHKASKHGIFESDAIYECLLCSKKFIIESDLNKHNRKSHLQQLNDGNCVFKIECQFCNIAFSDTEILKEHQKTKEHLEARRIAMANQKDKKTPNILVQSLPPDVPCEICDSKFADHRLLTLHQRKEHPSKDSLYCQICDKYFATTGGLKKHLVLHSEDKPFVCSTEGCGEKFNTKISLDKHETKHTGELLFSCQYCDKGFNKERVYRRHMCTNHSEVHLREKPVVCEVCYLNFVSADELKRHMNTHSHLICQECGKAFGYKHELQKHLKIHENLETTEEPDYKCNTCNLLFSENSSLEEHMKKCSEIGMEQSTSSNAHVNPPILNYNQQYNIVSQQHQEPENLQDLSMLSFIY